MVLKPDNPAAVGIREARFERFREAEAERKRIADQERELKAVKARTKLEEHALPVLQGWLTRLLREDAQALPYTHTYPRTSAGT